MVEELISHYTDGNKSQFASMLGLKPQTINAWISRNTFDAELIFTKCKGVSADWLMSGIEPMIKNGDSANLQDYDGGYIPRTASTTPSSIPLLPVSAMGGTLTGIAADSTLLRDCERIISPIKDADYAISVYGESMAPEYPSGSKVLIKRIDPSAFIDWGHTYVLDTRNGVILKQILYCDKEGCITCHSINEDPKYADFDVSMKDIFGIYRVLMCLSAK